MSVHEKLKESIELTREYQRLSRRAQFYNKYRARWVISIGLLAAFALLLLPDYLFGSLFIEEPFKTFKPFIAIGLIILALMIDMGLSDKAKPYRLAHEEWLFLDIYSTLDELDSFFETGLEPDRNRAVKRVRKIVETVEEEWEVGRLRLAKESIGKHVILFKRNLKEKVLPAIEEGDETNLRKSYDFLRIFANYLLKPNPTDNDLEQLNNSLSTITTVPSERLTFRAFLQKTYPKLQHILAVIGCGAGGISAYLIGHYYLGIRIEYAYTAGCAFTGTLLIAYVSYIRK